MELAQVPEDDRTLMTPPQPKVTGGTALEGLGDNALPAGTFLGEFEITGLIGEGGFGIVYLAYDHSLQRKVALKEYMPSGLAARKSGMTVAKSQQHLDTFQAGLRSFINEARLLAQFDHPSLVKVHRFWEGNGTAYMVMPFYDGKTLKEVLRQLSARPDEQWLKQLLGHLLDALEVIHGESCFHRDIAPDNILILKDGRPLLLDFGAARRVISDMTQNLTVILKPGYAPIEQYAEMKSMRQGAWTDIYALAAVIYFAITGKTPAPAVSRIISDSLEPLARLEYGQDRYSPAFLDAIDKGLAVKPEDRPQDIAAFRTLLDLKEGTYSSITKQPVAHSEQEMEYKASTEAVTRSANSTSAKARSPVGVYGLAVALFLAAAGAGWFFMRGEPRPTPEPPVPSEQIIPAPTPPAGNALPRESMEKGGTHPAVQSIPLPREVVPVSPEVPAETFAGIPERQTPEPKEQAEQKAEKSIPRASPGTRISPPAAPPSERARAEAKHEASTSAIYEIIGENLAEGSACLNNKNFECAIAKAQTVLRFEPSNRNAQVLLKDAHTGQEKAWQESELE